jgi:caa(3)-type oxidase subunit IV
VEVAVAFLSHIPKNILLLALVALAVWKAALVGMYFMHLKFESNRLRILAVAPIPLAFILVLAVITEFKW